MDGQHVHTRVQWYNRCEGPVHKCPYLYSAAFDDDFCDFCVFCCAGACLGVDLGENHPVFFGGSATSVFVVVLVLKRATGDASVRVIFIVFLLFPD